MKKFLPFLTKGASSCQVPLWLHSDTKPNSDMTLIPIEVFGFYLSVGIIYHLKNAEVWLDVFRELVMVTVRWGRGSAHAQTQ